MKFYPTLLITVACNAILSCTIIPDCPAPRPCSVSGVVLPRDTTDQVLDILVKYEYRTLTFRSPTPLLNLELDQDTVHILTEYASPPDAEGWYAYTATVDGDYFTYWIDYYCERDEQMIRHWDGH
jgi:hypothetical protein